MATERDRQIALEIARQVGDEAFFMMGTKPGRQGDMVYDVRSLQFRIRGCNRYDQIRITLTPVDVYDVEFIKIGRAPHFKVKIDRVEGIYSDMLHDVIRERTGLELTMPRIKGLNC